MQYEIIRYLGIFMENAYASWFTQKIITFSENGKLKLVFANVLLIGILQQTKKCIGVNDKKLQSIVVDSPMLCCKSFRSLQRWVENGRNTKANFSSSCSQLINWRNTLIFFDFNYCLRKIQVNFQCLIVAKFRKRYDWLTKFTYRMPDILIWLREQY